MPSQITIHRFKKFRGEVILPGSKSIANRVLLCAALAHGVTKIQNLPFADDISILLSALPKLGIKLILKKNKNSYTAEIKGNSGAFNTSKEINLYLENAGTAFRPLCAILCAGYGEFLLTGNEQMNNRPIKDLVDSLKSLNVNIECNENYPPVKIKANGLKGGIIKINANISSQYVSALLMAAPLSENSTTIKLEKPSVSQPYIEMTITILSKFGIIINKINELEYFIPPKQTYISPKKFYIEGDATAATYFLSAGSLPGCGKVKVKGLGLNSIQGDIEFVKILKSIGSKINIKKNFITVKGPKKNIKLKSLHKIDMNSYPDAAMTLAVLSLFLTETTIITGIANLRVKESDRITGLKNELEKLGAKVEVSLDEICITPPEKLINTKISTYKDHRMAMAFSIAAYGTDLTILDPDCTSKTYKNYFKDFMKFI